MDREAEALRLLLRATAAYPAGTPDRRREVANRANCSPDNLYQVAKGIALPSGKPRSLGRDVKERIDAAYPGWLDAVAPSPHPQATEPDLALQLANTVATMPPARWRSVRAQLDVLAGHPEMRDDVLQELRALLQPGSTKPQQAA